MARKSLQSDIVITDGVITQINDAIRDMLEKHAEEIGTVIDESDDRKATVNFKADFDCSESAPAITVGCRFSSSVTDRREIKCDDPTQPTLFSMKSPADIKREEEAAKKEADKAAKAEAKAAKKANKNKGTAEKEANSGDAESE